MSFHYYNLEDCVLEVNPIEEFSVENFFEVFICALALLKISLRGRVEN